MIAEALPGHASSSRSWRWSSRRSSASSSASSPACARAGSSTPPCWSLSLLVIAVPTFVIGFVLQFVVGVKLGWLPTDGRAPTPTFVSLLMPAIVLGAVSLAYVLRLTRTSVVGEPHGRLRAHRDAPRACPAAAWSPSHVLRNSLIPVVTFLGADLGALMGGAIVTEGIFNINGVGGTLYQAITQGESRHRRLAHHRARDRLHRRQPGRRPAVRGPGPEDPLCLTSFTPARHGPRAARGAPAPGALLRRARRDRPRRRRRRRRDRSARRACGARRGASCAVGRSSGSPPRSSSWSCVVAAFPQLFTSQDPRFCELANSLGAPQRGPPVRLHPPGLRHLRPRHLRRPRVGDRRRAHDRSRCSSSGPSSARSPASSAAGSTRSSRASPTSSSPSRWCSPRSSSCRCSASSRTSLTVVAVLASFGWPQIARITRGSVMSVKNNDYVTAAKSLGVSRTATLVRHILPNAAAPIIVYATVALGHVHRRRGDAELPRHRPAAVGRVVGRGHLAAPRPRCGPHPAVLFYPAGALALTVLGFIMMGDVVRDALDPKVRTAMTTTHQRRPGRHRPRPARPAAGDPRPGGGLPIRRPAWCPPSAAPTSPSTPARPSRSSASPARASPRPRTRSSTCCPAPAR